jgi:hypothetical protein
MTTTLKLTQTYLLNPLGGEGPALSWPVLTCGPHASVSKQQRRPIYPQNRQRTVRVAHASGEVGAGVERSQGSGDRPKKSASEKLINPRKINFLTQIEGVFVRRAGVARDGRQHDESLLQRYQHGPFSSLVLLFH